MTTLMKIKCAAVKHEGKIYTGHNHGKCILDAVIDTGVAPVLTVNQGFITECGRFVSRAEAACIAFKAGQIKEKLHILTSEDLR